MNRKCAMDLAISLVCMALLFIAILYPEWIRGGGTLAYVSGIMLNLFLFLAVWDSQPGKETVKKRDIRTERQPGRVTELVLLNEEDTEFRRWDIYGRTAVVIGRDVKENQVDIDLSASPYASMVEIEHAVINFSAGSWYVEDLGSTNGISVKKVADGRQYRLLAGTPCRIEQGDILYVGLNRLLLR